MDFYEIREQTAKKGTVEIFPNFLVDRSKDLMVRGGSFYAIWDEKSGMWSKDEFAVAKIVDKDLYNYADSIRERTNDHISVKAMRNFNSTSWKNFMTYLKNMPDNFHVFDEDLVYADTKLTREDYASRRLPYTFGGDDCSAFKEILETLYDPVEREKIEWAIGSIFSGDSKDIQKFLVLYGDAGSGKSTVLNIIQKLFHGYYKMFEAKSLGQNNNQFALEMFRENPLVAIQHDGDLSRIEDNSKLNSVISHEEMLINEKYKQPYSARINSFLFMATNKPVKITDAKSGILRRLIDVQPSGRLIATKRYFELMARIDFELGSIAEYCLGVYRKLGKNHYMGYQPIRMMYKTNPLFNFVEENYYIFKQDNGVSLKRAWEMYNQYISESGFSMKMNKMVFKEELKPYFDEFTNERRADNGYIRNYYSGFRTNKFETYKDLPETPSAIVMDSTTSILDHDLEDCTAQYVNSNETPEKYWENVETKLKDLDTSRLHYVLVPENHIVIDFDIKNDKGEKDPGLNLEAASKFPPTYAEYSKGGAGIHLHYIYDGDPKQLANTYANGVEIKVFTGKASLRRKLSYCNTTEIAHISSGLPMKEEKVIDFDGLRNEKAVRTLIERNLRKEVHPGTKPSIDFILKILDDAYFGGMSYDVTDMRPSILAFASNSTNHSAYCIKQVKLMKFKSDDITNEDNSPAESPIVFFDVEVFPNLFIVCWKIQGEDTTVNKMINPTPEDVEKLLDYKLVGFNNRRYDNHILYGRILGLNEEQLYTLSQRIINGSQNGTYAQAYGISYADIYDFSSKKQSLKKFEIELGIHHKELGLPWSEPVEESRWEQVASYCVNDVIATEAVFNNRKEDFIAREILADISGLTINDTTQKHTAKIVFGNDRNPQDKFVYTDLSEMFEGYHFDKGVSTYRDEVVGEGGYVYSEPGIHRNVALLDIASMHPTSIIQLNAFGPYTENFKQLLDARIAIKHKHYNEAKRMLGGVLKPYLNDGSDADKLAYALKIVVNIVYGLTSAKFENPFRDPRNIDNIVAKRGSLFMIDLKHAVQEQGYTVAHIKTDSIKIPNADQKIIDFVTEFGKMYGYMFEHEATYEKMCLINDSVYIAKLQDGPWTATGARFKHPYVFKTLFSGETTQLDDISETKTTKSAFYLDMNEGMPEDEHNYIFVGKAGAFVPVIPGEGGGLLVREQDGKMYAATGTMGYRWLETEVAKQRDDLKVDLRYTNQLVRDARDAIAEYGDPNEFIYS